MDSENTAVNSRAGNTAFAALLFTLLGYLLLEVGIFRQGARPGAHVISTVVGLTLFWLTRRVGAFDRLTGTAVRPGTAKLKSAALVTPANAASALLMLGIGYIAADAVRSGWATPILLFAVCMYLCPWSRIPLCRTTTLPPLFLICLGAGSQMYSGLYLPHPISLAFSVWTLWTFAVVSMLTAVLLKKKGSHVPQTAHRISETDVISEN
jgi:hypothetical protein